MGDPALEAGTIQITLRCNHANLYDTLMLKGYCTALMAVHATTGNALPFPLRCQHPQPRFCRTLLSNRKDKSNFGFPRKSPLSGQPHNTTRSFSGVDNPCLFLMFRH